MQHIKDINLFKTFLEKLKTAAPELTKLVTQIADKVKELYKKFLGLLSPEAKAYVESVRYLI